MKNHIKLIAAIVACLLCSAVTALVCLRLFGPDTELDKYREIEGIIQEYYVGDVDWQAMDDTVSAAQINALGDRWSRYLTADEYAAYRTLAANSYTGVGITVELDIASGRPMIVAVTPESPAGRAGLEVGNLLFSIGATELAGMTSVEVRDLIAGYGEKKFFLTVQNAQGATRTVELTCEIVFSNPVSYELMTGGIGYVRIRNFEDGCSENMRAAVDALQAEGALALIFDVRDNPGGKLNELIAALDYLLPAGDLFISLSREGEEVVYRSDDDDVDLPMAVLINRESFSAAEFFAAVLREYERATLVGEPTTGKSRSQVTLALPDGSAVRISNSRYLTPAGKDLREQGGLTPDIEALPVEGGSLDVVLSAAQTLLTP